jgi:hypothetical protein
MAPVPFTGAGRLLDANLLPIAKVEPRVGFLLLAVCRDSNCAFLAGHAEGPFQHGAHEHEARDYLNDYDCADEEDEGFGEETLFRNFAHSHDGCRADQH